MRLFLSSQGLSSEPEELVRLLDGARRVAVIASGVYLNDPAKRQRRIRSDVAELRSLGLDAAELDLRDPASRSTLAACDAVWVLGGDVIELLASFRASGADQIIQARLAEDTLVYAGYSAGACIVGPAFPSHEGFLTAGLDLVPFTVAPHAAPGSTKLVEWFDDHYIPFIALRDGQAVVVDGDSRRVVG